MLAVISVLVVEVSASSLVEIADPESVPPVCLIEVTVVLDPSGSESFLITFPEKSPLSLLLSSSVPSSPAPSLSVVTLSVEFS